MGKPRVWCLFLKGELVDPEDESIEEIMAQIDAGIDDLSEEAINRIKKIAVPIPKSYFQPSFIEDVKQDIKLLEQIYGDWFIDDDIGHDPKLEEVREKIQQMLAENPNRKIVIFSMYSDTAQYVYKSLINSGFERTLFYYGGSSAKDKQTVSANFDASYPAERQENDYDIIVATDALSEASTCTGPELLSTTISRITQREWFSVLVVLIASTKGL